MLGALLLALVAALAIGLPKAVGDSAGESGSGGGRTVSTEPVTLPDTLPGGYVAADTEAAFASIPEEQADQAGATVRNEQAARAYSDKALQAAGVPAAGRTYITPDGTPLIVQAFRAAGGAFAPLQINDPASAAAGDSVNDLITVDGLTCIQTGTADGAGGLQGGYIECQKSSDDFTIQVTSPLDADATVALVNTVWTELA